MPKIVVDGREIECREGIPVLQAVLEAGWDVPHYCYHPGLSIVASCRLCLMEMKMPHPQTKEPAWAPKLFPSCQTPVKEGLEVRFDSEAVRGAQQHTMEYYLVNHPLDCPVCDKAGECYLQDYSEKFGQASSRMIEDKLKNPKKDIGSRTLLYQDRCVLCSRCVRFCDEIAGAGELCIVDRGARAEIDVFPGVPLENELQGNVVDLCPVGCLLSKDFLFQQRVWLLRSIPSISPADSGGAAIWIDQNESRVYRVRPRFNEKANEWWISDEQRFDWKYIYRQDRLNQPRVRGADGLGPATWEELPAFVRERLTGAAQSDDGARVAAVLSPMMSVEEAFLLARFVRSLAPRSTLALGYTPVEGEDRKFPKGFVIRAEKAPNRRGVQRVIEHFGGAALEYDAFLAAAKQGRFSAAYVVGGYPKSWALNGTRSACEGLETLIVHDLFPSPLDEIAAARIPAAAWAEREGSFMNHAGLLQAFQRAVNPLEGVKADGQFLYELAGERGLFRAAKVRDMIAAEIADFPQVFEPRPEPEFAH